MERKKDDLERVLQNLKINKEGVNIEMSLQEFSRRLWQEVYPETKGRSSFSSGIRRAICMLERLYDGYGPSDFVPRQIHTINDIYSLTEREIMYGFRGYGRKTWITLNKILAMHGLPLVQLPQEYTSVLQSYQR